MLGADGDRRLLKAMTYRAAKQRIGADGGLTLPELLVATVLGLMVVGAAVTVFASGVQSQPKISDRNAADPAGADDGRDADARASPGLERDHRPAARTSRSSPTCRAPPAARPRPGTPIRCKVFYSCSIAGTCTRTECPPNFTAVGAGCGTTRTMVTGLADNNVFTFSPRVPGEAYVDVRLSFPATNGDDAITMEDGVALRNPPLGAP